MANAFTSLISISKHEIHSILYRLLIILLPAFFRPFGLNLYHEKVARLEEFPPPGQVFAIDFGRDGLHRAVCNSNVKSIHFKRINILF